MNITGGAAALTNTGTISTVGGAGLAGVLINSTYTLGTGTITNSGTITGGGDATHGYGVEVLDGLITLTNQSGGAIAGGQGAILLGSNDLATLNLEFGSNTNGLIRVSGTGNVTTTLAGALTGTYDASSSTTGTDNLTLTSTGVLAGGASGIATTRTLNLTNAGSITGTTDGVNISGGAALTLVNSGAIQTAGGLGAAAVYISSASTHSVTNTGTITGGNHATLGYAINVEDGETTINNNSGGQINGQSGLAGGNAIRMISDDLVTLNLNAGSTVNGGILSTSSGARTITLAGSVTGVYDGTGGTGVDTFTLTSTGSITGPVALGAGDDVFNWQGGTIGGTINAGGGTADVFNSVLGAGSGSLNLSNLSLFETYSHQSGTLTLTGSRSGGAVWNIASGTTLNFEGSLTATSGTGYGITAASGATVNVLGTGVLENWVGLFFNGGSTSTVTNSGSILGSSVGVFSTSGRVNFTNNAGGTVSTAGGSAGTAIALASGGGTIINNGSVMAATTAGISSSNIGAGGSETSLTNGVTGTVTGGSAGVLMTGSGAFNVTNAGAISAGDIGTGFGIHQTAGTVTIANNSGGSITGNGYAVNTTGGSLVLTNASGATLSGGSVGSIQAATSGAATIDLQAGSTTTGDIILSGGGTRTLTIAGAFNGNLDGTGNAGWVNLTLDTSATGYTLLHAGSSSVDFLTFTGSGSRTFSVDNLSNWDRGNFVGGGDWTLTGTGNGNSFALGGIQIYDGADVRISNTQQLQGATSIMLTSAGSLTATTSLSNTRTIDLAGAGTLNAASGQTLTQSGVVSGAGVLSLSGLGTVALTGNNTYTGGTVVNSGILQLGHTSAAGTGLIRMIDPQINFAATGTYNNAISLEVVDGQQSADPTILNNTSGGAITLAGRIYETNGVGGAGQYVTFSGAGGITLTNSANSWAGVTRINSGATLLGTTATISGASIVNNGTLTYQNTSAGTANQAISGSGTIVINGTAATTLAGAITTTGQLTVSGAGANLILSGARSGSTNTGAVISGAGASLTVADTGSIQSGQYNGVRFTSGGVGATLTNLGTIQNAGSGADGGVGAGVYVQNLGAGGTTTINNGSLTDTGAGSTIRGFNAGIRHESGSTDLLVINNYGLIVGDVWNGIENTAGGLTVNNFAGGFITTAVGNGVGSSSSSAVSVTNAGTIGRNIAGTVTVDGYGVSTNGALTLNNQSGGGIYGDLGGVQTNAAGASITNGGTISGALGVQLNAGGTVANQAGGAILATNGYGVRALSGGLALTNGGVIRSVGGAGVTGTAVSTNGVSSITNNAGGVIAGLYNGATLAGGINTVINNGVIAGVQNGVSGSGFAHGITNSGVIVAGAVSDAATALADADRSGAPTDATGVTLSTGGTVTNLATGEIAGRAAGVRMTSGGTVVNAGLIDANGVLGADAGVLLDAGGVVTNQVGGTISGALFGVRSSAGTLTLTNAGTITGASEGVSSIGALTMTNTGSVSATSFAGVTFHGAGSLDNYGSITGGTFGVQNNSASGVTTITNRSGGAISGGTGSILISGAGATTIDLQAGSTTTGQIIAASTGARTVTVAGVLDGVYDGAYGANTGVDNLTLASTGSMTSANLGAGADSFIYQGGTFSGFIDAGTGTDSLISNLAGGSASLNFNNLGFFEIFAHQSGTLTTTGTGIFAAGVSVQGGALIVDGTMLGAVGVANGATLSGGGSIAGAVTVADGGALIGAQGDTLTVTSLSLASGSTIYATFSSAGGPALFAVTGDLTLDGTVNVASTGAYGFGVYGLMTYGGVLTDNGLVIGTTPGGAQRVQVQTSVAGQVNIVHAPTELLFWDGGNAGQHDNGAVNGGSGTWTAAGSEWTDANGLSNGAMEPQPGFAIFQGAGGTVTVDEVNGAVGVTGMQFAADGYSVVGDSITLADPSTIIRVGDGTAPSAAWTATIASALTGAGGLVKTDLGTLILAGDSDYTGGTTVNAGTLQIGDGATAGSIAGAVVNNAALIFARSDNHDFANDVSGSGLISINGVVTLSGAITASPGVTILDGASLTSTGAITATEAVTFANGGAFANAGTVNGDVAKNGAADATVTNTGAINGIVYNTGSGLLTIDNQAGGSIVGAGLTAVLSTASGAISLTNAGDISGASYAFLSNNALDSVTNSGRMVAGSIVGGVVTSGGFDAIRLNAGGSVVNQSGGLITGTQGVASYAGTLTLDNQLGAAITGEEYGVHSYAAANIVNAGVIGATQYAGIALGAGGTITNSGVIGGGNQFGANQGISVEGSTVIVNLAGGVINNGILSLGSGLFDLDIQAGSTVNGNVINISTGGVLQLAGELNGSYAGSTGDDAVTLISGGTFSGVLQGNGGVDSFELAGAGAGSLDISQVLGFESRAMNGTGVWTLTGFDSSTTGWSINAGALAASGGSAINDAAAVTIAGPGTLQLNNSEQIGSLNGAGAVALGANTLTVGGGGASAYAGVIGGTGDLRVAGGSTLTLSGSNTYSGTTYVIGGTLRLGASNVLSDVSHLNVASGGVMDLQGFSDTVASALLSGVLNGTGTLTAADYALNGATVNANLGAGALYNASGTSTLNGESAADLVTVLDGSLALGASDRIIDTADLHVAGATFDLGAFDETVNVTAIAGTLAGTGTLTAVQHQLYDATVNANLAGGSVYVIGGASTLNGLSNADLLSVLGGSLTLGASDRIVDTATLGVSSGAVLNIGAFNESVAIAALNGTVNGTGTLTAGEYDLNGATVNANLGAGDLYNTGGVSTLNGTSAADLVSVVDGTLVLGASDRLADNATVTVASGSTLNLGAFNDTVDLALLEGTLAGTGTLTAVDYLLDSATVNANLGAGALYSLGASTLNGLSGAGLVSVQDGTLTLGASDRLSDAAVLVVADGILNLGAFDETVATAVLNSGTLNGTGTLTAADYLLNDATVNANLGAGVLYSVGASTLNGTAAAEEVFVDGGVLTLGAANRLADNAVVTVSSGAALNLGAFDETIGLLTLNGALNGTGTLSAAQYQLNAATVNANLGVGLLIQQSGASTLNGTAGAAQVALLGGTLTLGASNRLADNATVAVSSGSTLDLGAFNDTVGLVGLSGTLAGTGTLTAGEYDLSGATVNANLGAGNLFNTGGVSTLNGTSEASSVVAQAGTLTLGASDRLADTATVSVASGSTLNLGAFNDTVGLAVLNGALAGTGTLTAAQYQLNAATVDANLGAGTLFNLGGVSTLNGTAGASQASINAGTLRLGASERLSDAATVSVASGATFDINGFDERIGALFGTGDVNVGAGRLTFGGVESGFGGRLSGAGLLVHTGGLFTLMGDHTIASISNTGGELRFLGTTTGGLSASGGSVTGAGTIGGALRASNGAVLSPGLAGVQDGIGGFGAGGLVLNGGTLAIDVLGKSGGNLIDQLRINGTATLTGGLLAPTFQGSAATDFDFSTRYLFLQANNLVGTFANGGTFTAAAQEGLFWRIRYDLSPNAAVLELRELTDFDPGATGTGNQRSVGQALSGGQLAASDDWAAILSLIAGLSDAERAAAFDSVSGEPLADVTSSMFSANDSFLTAVRDGGLNGRDGGGEALNFVDRLSFAGGRENSADRLGDVLGAFDPSASTKRGAGGWVSAYAGDQTLDGKPGQATVESTLNGFAGGYGVRNGSMSVGAAGGITRLEGDVVARDGHYESDLSHAAGYAAFDDGVWAADLTATFYGGDLDTRRGITVGAFSGQAIGNTHVEGQALSASVARRFQVSDDTMIALGAIGTASNASVDGYTETGAGGLSLQASGMERDWQSLQLSVRGTQDYRVNGQGYRIYAGAGVMATAGDRQATGDMRFTGAATGFGTFTVEGAETPPLAGLVDFGLEVGAGEGVTVSAGYRGLFSERLQDNQVGVKLKVNW